MRVLLTGAAGFIGSKISDQLIGAGHQVVQVDKGASDQGVLADIREPDPLRDLLDGVDVVCHQAAKVGLGLSAADAPDYASNNLYGTAVLLAAMAEVGVTRLVQASSMVVYGEGGYRCSEHGSVRPGQRRAADLADGRFDPPCPLCGSGLRSVTIDEDAPLDPRNTYAATKVGQEHLAAAWVYQTGGAVTSLRYHNVYGPGMPRNTPYAGVASIFRTALAAGQAPQVYEDGRQLRDFVHVADVARANVLAIERLAASDQDQEVLALNIASGEPRTVGDLAISLATELHGPAPVIVGGGRSGDVRHIVADPARARKILNFSAQIPFAQGISALVTP